MQHDYLQDLHILDFIIQHNFNKNNKQALQYSANNNNGVLYQNNLH